MITCPYCTDTRRYTDPLGHVRCVRCFNHVTADIDQPAPVIGGVYNDADPPYAWVQSTPPPPRERIHIGR